MKVKYYETVFKVTETLQNGKERQIKKSVLSPIFINGKHHIEIDRIRKAESALKEEHYYNIEYIETKTKELIFT